MRTKIEYTTKNKEQRTQSQNGLVFESYSAEIAGHSVAGASLYKSGAFRFGKTARNLESETNDKTETAGKLAAQAHHAPFNSLKGARAVCRFSPPGDGGSEGIRMDRNVEYRLTNNDLRFNKTNKLEARSSQLVADIIKEQKTYPKSLHVREVRTVANTIKQSSAYET